MVEEEHIPNFCTPMHVQWPDAEKVKCRDCLYRNISIVSLPSDKGKKREVGSTADTCLIYDDWRGKPDGILFNNDECEHYEKDSNYPIV